MKISLNWNSLKEDLARTSISNKTEKESKPLTSSKNYTFEMNEMLEQAEKELGIIFPPSKIQLMLVKSVSLKDCLSGSVILDSRDSKERLMNSEVPQTKEYMLQELRDFVIKNNRIQVEYYQSQENWRSNFPLNARKDVTALRFEKKELGEFIGM